jgi:hypothetical protein
MKIVLRAMMGTSEEHAHSGEVVHKIRQSPRGGCKLEKKVDFAVSLFSTHNSSSSPLDFM